MRSAAESPSQDLSVPRPNVYTSWQQVLQQDSSVGREGAAGTRQTQNTWQVKFPAFQKGLDNISHYFSCSHRAPRGLEPAYSFLRPEAERNGAGRLRVLLSSQRWGQASRHRGRISARGGCKGRHRPRSLSPLPQSGRPGACTMEVAAPFCELVPWHWQVCTSTQAGMPPRPQTLCSSPRGPDTGFPGSKAPVRSMTGRLLSEDSEPTRSCRAEYLPFFSLPVKNLRKGVGVRGQTDLAPPQTGGGPLRESKAGLHVQTRNGEGSKAPWLGRSGLSPILE